MTYRSLIPYVHVRNLALERYAWRRAAAHPFVCYLLRRVLRAENMGRAGLRPKPRDWDLRVIAGAAAALSWRGRAGKWH